MFRFCVLHQAVKHPPADAFSPATFLFFVRREVGEVDPRRASPPDQSPLLSSSVFKQASRSSFQPKLFFFNHGSVSLAPSFRRLHPRQSDNFNNIMSSFQLDPSNPGSSEAMARGDPVDAFLKVRSCLDYQIEISEVFCFFFFIASSPQVTCSARDDCCT